MSKQEGHLLLPEPLLPDILAHPRSLGEEVAPVPPLGVCGRGSIYQLRALDNPPFSLQHTKSVSPLNPAKSVSSNRVCKLVV
jgi:hypothetical protein